MVYESTIFFSVLGLIVYALVYNLFHYNPVWGYDGEAHHAYVQNFLNIFGPNKSDQPASNFTYEFFSPPLPYIFPTFVNEVCKSFSPINDNLEFCQNLYGFVNIIFLSLVYLSLLFLYMKIVNKVLKSNRFMSSITLLVLGLFSVNYKAISMIRGEMYILFLSAFLIYRLLILPIKKKVNIFRISY